MLVDIMLSDAYIHIDTTDYFQLVKMGLLGVPGGSV